MSSIDNVQQAMESANAIRLSLDEQGAGIYEVKGNVEMALASTIYVREYLENLSRILSDNSLPSYDEATAHQKTEDLESQINEIVNSIERVRELLVTVAGTAENLSMHLANLMSR